MASVLFDEVWVHLADRPQEYVRAKAATALSETDTVAGEVRHYAGGVARAVASSQRTRMVDVTFTEVPRADFERLRSWVGLDVFLRDPLGRLMFGVFHSVEGSERPGNRATVRRVSLSLEATSRSEVMC